MNRITKIKRKTKNSLFFLLAAMMILMTTGFTASGQHEFITTWQATGNSITIPTAGGGYNYNVYWEEIGNEVNNNGNATATGNYTINTTNANQYRVKITGQFPMIYFNDGGDKNKILTIEQWGDIAWTDMSEAFFGCSNLTVPAADAPDLSGVTSLMNMFKNCTLLTVDHIDLWDVSHVQYMDGMFVSCTSFNGNIGGWNVGSVIGMSWMFYDASIFNQDIGSWDMSNVVSTFVMFHQASQFNQDIGNWNVGNVVGMVGMFHGATSFNQDISNWNVGNVTNMSFMFQDATAFNQNLGNWDVTQVSTMDGMLNNSGLSKENYSLTLAGWASKNVKTNVPLGAQGLEYDKNDGGRKALRSKSWNITGDICIDCSFITIWQATGNSITIPTTGGGYNYNIYWEEIGNEVNNNGNATATGNHTINTTNANQYRVKITGQFPRIYFNDGGDKNKILTIEQWGDIAWTSMSEAFFGCSNLTVPAADAPDLSGVSSLSNMFKNATSLTVDYIDLWDVSHVQYMDGMFVSCTSFNGNIGGWDVSNVRRFRWMFEKATTFNQDIGSWDMSSAVSTYAMFYQASQFNKDIGNWDVSNVTDMAFMFSQALSFNQNIGNWNVSNVTNMNAMFRNATSFNQNIGHWNVGNVTNMNAIFRNATSFSQNIGNWNVGNVTSMVEMFMDATAFNQNIGSWDVSNVTAMNGMFRNATSFNQDIGNWNVGNVINMGVMFWNATAFNQNIGSWDVGNVTNMGGMFWDATAFNQDISNWNVSNVTGMNAMFQNAAAFNHNLGNWNVTKVTTMDGMFNNSALSKDNYELTLTGWASKNVLNSVTLGASGLKYCSETDRNTLIATKGWTITGDAKLCSQTITFNALPAQVYGDIFTLSATASSGLRVTYSSSDPSIASIVDNTVTVHATGNITITATQSGDANNEAANSEQQSLTINPKPVTVTATSGQTKTYGEADPVFTYSVDQPLINGDVFSGSLGRTVGENAGSYPINQNTLTAGSNYTITFVGDDFQITPKEITVTATSGQTKSYGEADPVFTYSVDQPLINGDVFSGSLARIAGENVGTYLIHQNTLTAGNNYVIQFVSADFHILKLDQMIMFEPIPDKTVGEDPFTVVATASSALPLSFTSSDETVVVISGDLLTIVGAGDVTITAIQAGDDIYNPQESTYTFTVHATSLFIPTLFSPDGNGVNDLFLVRGADIEAIQFVVFDMLGNEVYRATDVDTATRKGWDGTKGGVNQPAGAYLWSLKGKLRNGSTLLFQGKSSGQVVLMR